MAIRAVGVAATARGSIIVSSQSENRHCFLSLHPPPRPNHHHFHGYVGSIPSTSTTTSTNGVFIHLEPIGPKSRRRSELLTIPKAADSTQPSSVSSSAGKTVVADDQFSLAKVSFGVIGLSVGISLLGYGFGAYFNILPGSEWSALMLTYGFPLAIIGMALKYAELKPVPCLTYSDAEKLRETYATPILKQVRNDVIRYRYGDEQHLEEALKRIFQYGQGGGIPRRSAPILQSIREEVTEDGRYSLVLVFEAKALQLSDFERRQAKFTSFFGPGITAEVAKGEKDLYEVRLISNANSTGSP
ncbi:uncharacterized protein LOC107416554 [Ziziphus jujuba]|uniref:Uncharacterized protein LOC107416554 n=2 Tax=Ziziphus jujuba TaxID=326968 RepID=A0A6P3ZN18_ZIZJJ|nr:uncharacterized protein LOC107416554 [Ziziphus jujuba]KAH7532886.1 hypothetical protein FEM48_Zijuj04G0070100 [Ziziphus jujuba var. spinosa]